LIASPSEASGSRTGTSFGRQPTRCAGGMPASPGPGPGPHARRRRAARRL